MAVRLIYKPTLISSLISFLLGISFPFHFSANKTPLATIFANEQPTFTPVFSDVVNSLEPSASSILQELIETQAQQKEAEKLAQLRSGFIPPQYRSKTLEKVQLPKEKKVIALTFDDGPWPEYTNHILYVLEKHNIQATFFILGQNAQNYPNLLKQIVRKGHALGNHTWSHPYRYQTPASAAKQIDRTDEVIYNLTGIKTSLFRPPGGFLNNGLASYAHQKGYAVIMWSADSQDYRSSKNVLLKNLLYQTDSGGILLMHDGGGNRWHTLVALPYLIEELKKQGYRFVTVPELLMMGANIQ
ncbi:MAG: polysaccharide deacetylase family protein [Chroococcales cyanobacterium]